jgi:crotonobetainyl-CoA:carnitine CoA-transferase CaiB-like acyl-CoA transferase
VADDRVASHPLAGLQVVEVALGVSDLGLGLAGGVPGMVLGDLGATVTRVVDAAPAPIDAWVTWGDAWHRAKRIVASADPSAVASLLGDADIAFVYGPETAIEQAGLGYAPIARANPGLVYARCRPSRTARGAVDDYGLLVEARAGFCTQLAGHRPGPIFVDVRATGSGAAFLLTTSALALLLRRERTGLGGWSETSLYDGMLATLGCMLGRSEQAPAPVEGYWASGSTYPNFLYRCADGELLQVWFGGKGMYAKLIEVLGDEPSTEGYYADQVNGGLQERKERWHSFFVRQPRDLWIEQLRAAGVACEPILEPAEALTDPHLAEVGLAVAGADGATFAGTPIAVQPLVAGAASSPSDGDPAVAPEGGLLAGLKVLDFSAFVAGPLGAQVLADLGADVIKVEPPEGEAMRAAAYAVAACQRGKRSLTIDLGHPEARPVVERLIGWADVVLHNFRVGVSERLRIDEATVGQLNPQAVYCHASAFGPDGPRATYPGNDALMQAVTGFERAVGGVGNDPLAATWIPIDMSGGWIAAAGILAGLYARARTGRGQQVATSLLGAGMLLQSGAYRQGDSVVGGPQLDADQTGYGPGYRLYEAGDGQWFALVVPDPSAWDRLRALPEAALLPAAYVPLRGGATDVDALEAEKVLETAFLGAPAAAWVERLRDLGLLAELVDDVDRDGFRRGILDDPVNQQLGRTVAYEAFDWGHFEQIGRLLRCGPDAETATPLMLPAIGEHTVEVLLELGFDQVEVDQLLAARAVGGS